eukprot:TRINITY_DN8541_c0_g2_i2.p1 TRINITY_DN8541_c0_g2~~TRINITY_DN8541_c0_g2_i2.p1  ORF type:complete len:490 (-),score=74.10 TRINITY_DN8541_c0_g2_i2:368-1837(-)
MYVELAAAAGQPRCITAGLASKSPMLRPVGLLALSGPTRHAAGRAFSQEILPGSSFAWRSHGALVALTATVAAARSRTTGGYRCWLPSRRSLKAICRQQKQSHYEGEVATQTAEWRRYASSSSSSSSSSAVPSRPARRRYSNDVAAAGQPCEGRFLVNDEILSTRTSALAYRLSKRLDDRDSHGTGAKWGSVVTGVDEGDGWLRVGDRFLPIELQGRYVLTPLPEEVRSVGSVSSSKGVGATGVLPRLPAEFVSALGKYTDGRTAQRLSEEMFFFEDFAGGADDRSVFDQLMRELTFHDCWLNTGMKFARSICLGSNEVVENSPTYRALIDRVTSHFGVTAIRSLVNLYRDGRDWCNLHHDQYHQGDYPIDLTVGITLGAERELIFVEKRTEKEIHMPLRNGSAFAFSDNVNSTWRHMIPRGAPGTKKRISVIIWCTRQPGAVGTKPGGPISLGDFPHMLYEDPQAPRPPRRGSKTSWSQGRQGARRFR